MFLRSLGEYFIRSISLILSLEARPDPLIMLVSVQIQLYATDFRLAIKNLYQKERVEYKTGLAEMQEENMSIFSCAKAGNQ